MEEEFISPKQLFTHVYFWSVELPLTTIEPIRFSVKKLTTIFQLHDWF